MEKIYFKVVERFPEIKRDEIKVEYDNSLEGKAEIFTFEHPPYLNIGKSFFEFKDEEKEVIIAHELGHYISDKDIHPKKRMRRIKWGLERENYNKKIIILKLLSNLNKKRRQRNKRLKKRSILSQRYADNQALKRGYGPQLLSLLKKIYKKCYRSEEMETRTRKNISIRKMIDGLRQLKRQ